MALTINSLQARLRQDQQELESEIAQVVNDLELFISRNLPNILAEATKGNVDPAVALNSLIDEFKSGGLGQQLGNIAEIYGNELRRVEAIAIADGLMTTEQFRAVIDVDTIEALIRFRVEDIQNKAVEVVGSIRPIILENVILGTTPNLSALAETVSTSLLNFTRTELNTALLSFSRMVSQVQAESVGITLFYYMGPDDKITRPFCGKILHGHTPPIYTSKEIAALDNGQGLPPAIYGGGYNCRHRWMALTARKAKEFGYGD